MLPDGIFHLLYNQNLTIFSDTLSKLCLLLPLRFFYHLCFCFFNIQPLLGLSINKIVYGGDYPLGPLPVACFICGFVV